LIDSSLIVEIGNKYWNRKPHKFHPITSISVQHSPNRVIFEFRDDIKDNEILDILQLVMKELDGRSI
jgi:hypothetical protein